jgi:hypothetical protein
VHRDNSFIAEFSSQIELQRAIAFDGADTKAVSQTGYVFPNGVRVKFELWHERWKVFYYRMLR